MELFGFIFDTLVIFDSTACWGIDRSISFSLMDIFHANCIDVPMKSMK
jgi:hypothetical protein